MLDLLFGPAKRAASWTDWFSGGMSSMSGRVRTNAGVVVDEMTALTLGAVWCATRIISETTASLPLFTYRRTGGGRGDTEHATDHYLYDLLKTAPNEAMGSMAFREGRTMHQVNWGQGFAEIEWDSYTPARRTRVVSLHPIHPSRVRPTRWGDDWSEKGYRYLVRNNDGTQTAMMADEMLHVPGVLSEDGIWAKGTIAYARESIGMGIGTERYGANWFGNGGKPRGVVTGLNMKDPEQRRLFRSEWKEIHGSPDSGEIAIIPADAKYSPIDIPPEDGQFLQTRVHNVREVGRWYRIPSHMLGDLEKASYNSIEQLGLEFVIYSLLPWLRRWEEQINLKLILPQDRGSIFVEHQLAGLARGDLQSRMNAYKVALSCGLMSINECRRLENMNGIGPSGDQYYLPLNMTTADRMMTGDLPTPATKTLPGRGMNDGDSQDGNGRDGTDPAGPADAATFDRYTRRLAIGHRKEDVANQRAVRAVLADAFQRALTKLAKDLGRQAAKITNFDEWLTRFLGDHGPTLAEALDPAAALVPSLGLVTGATLWERLAQDARQTLGLAFDTLTHQQFADMLATWPRERAALMAEEALRREPPAAVEHLHSRKKIEYDDLNRPVVVEEYRNDA